MNPNPYQSPWVDMAMTNIVDRTQREALATAIRRYISGEITAFELDTLLWDFGTSADGTVKEIAHLMWYHYDDCTDHHVRASKWEWDYFQRLLLLLESDRCLTIDVARRWSWTQLVAAASLVGFFAAAVSIGWGLQLLAIAIPFGAISIALSWWRRDVRPIGPYEQILVPFATFDELRATYESVRGFRKHRYPTGIAREEIQTPVNSRAAMRQAHLNMYAAWLTLAPFALIAQMFPVTRRTPRVVPTAPLR